MRLINRRPSPRAGQILATIPFLALMVAYVTASAVRQAANPQDKLLPGLGQMVAAMHRMAFTQDVASGTYLMLNDTATSLRRLLLGLAIAVAISFATGIAVGMVPYLRRLFVPAIAAFSMVPPLAILPILFIMLGIDETAKVALIVIGTAPFMIRDLILRVEELPRPELIKAQTLGGSTWQIALRVVVPQMLPRLIDSVRLRSGRLRGDARGRSRGRQRAQARRRELPHDHRRARAGQRHHGGARDRRPSGAGI